MKHFYSTFCLIALLGFSLSAQNAGLGYFIPPFNTNPIDEFVSLEVDDYQYVVDPASEMVNVTLVNNSSIRLFSANIKYQIGNGEILTKECIDLSVMPNESFEIPLALNELIKGEKHILTVWAEDVNGDKNVKLAEQKTEIRALSAAIQRLPLFEMFTSSTCGPCKTMNDGLNPMLKDPMNKGKYACIKYQMDWPGSGDPYYIPEGGTRRANYAVSGVPALFLDGTRVTSGTYQGNLDSRVSVPTDLEISGTYDFDPATHTIDVSVDVNSSFSYGPYHRFWIALLEKTTTGNKRSNGESEFEYVLMDFITKSAGERISDLANGYSNTFSFGVDYDPAAVNVEEWEDIAVVAFVQHQSTEEVLNSAWILNSTSGVNEISNTLRDLNIYPNPNQGQANVDFELLESLNADYKVYNLSGQLVQEKNLGLLSTGKHQTTIEMENPQPGFYFLELNLGGKLVSRSFQIN